ncbi:ABC transporter ATP-binding protein [Alkalihalobacillus sp. AL-G]|uniref:ABC transporter ATP-binding protein n=1 Tax=Alkalihalobacillus sp. AL-G TaxID=2926399 RepID=UPI0027297696|nr:ABC transporter ATP-binding protein [Alkalihalobacillus sp. AL-G]WLD94402.1 ABC transporter ATP-binding protein [Alkalihalobacillus sp. AL-G]
MMSKTILDVKNLTVNFKAKKGEIAVVNNVSFNVKEGETLGIVGESGSGKSVTSLSIMGLLPSPGGRVGTGKILFKDKDLVQYSKRQMRKMCGKEIAMIFQEPMTSLNPAYTVGNQIVEPLLIHTNCSKSSARKRAIELLKLVEIPRAEEVINDYPHQLSGGMRQRVMIAIALSCNPKLLIADEPTTALDVTIQAQILELMKKLKQEYNTSTILISHDLGVIAEMCDRVIVMYAGKVVEEGSVVEIFINPQHPYTKGLLKSNPSLSDDKEKLYTIEGTVPTPDKMPNGCRFAPRCEFVHQKCIDNDPESTFIKKDHQASCWLHSMEVVSS